MRNLEELSRVGRGTLHDRPVTRHTTELTSDGARAGNTKVRYDQNLKAVASPSPTTLAATLSATGSVSPRR